MRTLTSNIWDVNIDELTSDFQSTFEKLSTQEINWKPSVDTWSIAENINHIIKTNTSFFSIIESVKNGSYKPPYVAKFSILVNFFGRIIFKGVDPNRKKRMKTFNIWEPDKKRVFPDIIDEFQKHQTELKQLINNSSELLAKGTVISSPANKRIVYKLETALDIIISHERRHFNQALEVLNDKNFAKN